MGPKRLIILAIALVAAVGAALLVRMLGGGDHNSQAATVGAPRAIQPSQIKVLVAARDLAIGDRLNDSDLAWQPWPADGLNPAFVTGGAAPPDASGKAATGDKVAAIAANAADKAKSAMAGMNTGPSAMFIGAVVRETVSKGEPLTEKKVVRAGASGVMAVRLEPGMRAMAVPLSAESSAGGFILPGDHVDVVQTRKIEGAQVVSSTVMKNVRVLAVDQNAGRLDKIATLGATATLEVAPEQAEALVLARAQGELTLVLRSYADAAGPTVEGQIKRAQDLVTPQVVHVFRGGAAADVRVAR
jgi:pilus assembly protein CpaB